MRRQLAPALMMTMAMIVLTGFAYPLVVTGVGQLAFNRQVNGSLVEQDGQVVGSSLLGQRFTQPQYFQPRPSVADYNGLASGASNLGPTNPDLLAAISERTAAYRELNRLGLEVDVPSDAVTASASGLDPDISVANARLQAPRVAEVRGMRVDDVLALVRRHTNGLGDKVVNVLELNLDLDGRK